MLLQIHEPIDLVSNQQNSQSVQQTVSYALGIDLGTSNSLAATVIGQEIIVLKQNDNKALLPSVVHISQNGIEVGEKAIDKATLFPQQTFFSIKRLMGKSVSDIQAIKKANPKSILYPILADERNMPFMVTPQGQMTPVSISSEILKALYLRAFASIEAIERQRAEKENTSPRKIEIKGVVITVPAYFDDGERLATREAARLANLPVLRLLNEPTAAAIAYGFEQLTKGTFLIFDLGGGTFDVSILQLHQGVFEVLATGGDTLLGGDDIDALVVQWLAEKSNILLSVCQNESLLAQFWQLARKVKEQLSECDSVTITTPTNIQCVLTRLILQEMIAPIVARCLKICERVCIDAGIEHQALDDIILVGGSTRIPYIQEKVSAFFQKEARCTLNPEEVVAMGAARQANMLIGNKQTKDMVLLDVIPLSLGLELMGGINEKIIPRNSKVPVVVKQTFTTHVDNQTGLSLHIVQGERELAKDCRSLAHFNLKGIPPMKAGLPRIEVCFKVDMDGLLTVEARELHSNISQMIEVKPTFGLSAHDIKTRINDAIVNATDDIKNRKQAEQIVEAKTFLKVSEELINELNNSQGMLEHIKETMPHFDEFLQSVDELQQALQNNDTNLILNLKRTLVERVEPIALARLNWQLQRNLSGKTVEECL